jgi:hypothetical protein
MFLSFFYYFNTLVEPIATTLLFMRNEVSLFQQKFTKSNNIHNIDKGDNSSDYLVEFDINEKKVCDFYRLESLLIIKYIESNTRS